MNTLQEFHDKIKSELIDKIYNDIIDSIKGDVLQIAKDIASDVHLSTIYQQDIIADRLKLDISENMVVKELERKCDFLAKKLAQNGIR